MSCDLYSYAVEDIQENYCGTSFNEEKSWLCIVHCKCNLNYISCIVGMVIICL